MKPPISKWHDGLMLALTLSVILFVVSYSRLAGDSQSMGFRDYVLNSLYAGPVWGTTLSYNLIKFALGVVLLHLLFGAACWMMGSLSFKAWPSEKTSKRQHVMIWFILFTAAVLANNASTFTTSSLGEPYAEIMSVKVLGIALGRVFLILALAFAAITTLVAGLRWWRSGGRVSRNGYVALGAMGIAAVVSAAQSFPVHRAPQSADKPNVILIGLDSLREDLLDERLSPNVTPHLATFMKKGTHFTNAITPLARTFPSMCSMLTGLSPHTSGAVMNLLPRDLIDDHQSMPRLLARAGYQTVYATDEVRFANIDTTFGFAQTISPPIGASEFLIEKFADAPVLNLLVNTRFIGWLFPHVYANRGAARTYDPDTFVDRVDRELVVDKPLFFVTHLTLGHWPYIWAGSPIKRADREARWPPYYLNSARRVDQQFADIMGVLEQKGLLENALVIVYSDHGESFGSHNEALVPDEDPLIQSLGAKPAWGHGSTVLTDHQFRIVLGMRRFGAPWVDGTRIDAPVSFEDIAPTVVDLLRIPTSAPFDGRSLAGLIHGGEIASKAFAGRIRFTETEYQLPADFATPEGKVSASKVEQALALYRIDRVTDRITVKQSHVDQLLTHRQYAAVGDRYLLAAVPRKIEPGFYFLVVDIEGGLPKQLLVPPGPEDLELSALWTALHAKLESIRAIPPPVANSAVANTDLTIPPGVTK
jgi:hypothetical protein